jgi:hypothetical protein
VPRAVRIAVLVNPANVPTAEATLRDMPEAARALGLQIQFLNASTIREIEAAFADLVRDGAEALFVAGDVFFTSRRVQFATLAARYGIPAAYPGREVVEVGGLMSYATDRADMYRQVGAYRSIAGPSGRPSSPSGQRHCVRFRNRTGGGSEGGHHDHPHRFCHSPRPGRHRSRRQPRAARRKPDRGQFSSRPSWPQNR